MVGVAVGQPVAVVFREVPGEGRRPGVEAGLLCQLWVGIGGHAEGRRFLEGAGCRVDADMDVGGLPTVGGVDVTRTRRRNADQVGQGLE